MTTNGTTQTRRPTSRTRSRPFRALRRLTTPTATQRRTEAATPTSTTPGTAWWRSTNDGTTMADYGYTGLGQRVTDARLNDDRSVLFVLMASTGRASRGVVHRYRLVAGLCRRPGAARSTKPRQRRVGSATLLQTDVNWNVTRWSMSTATCWSATTTIWRGHGADAVLDGAGEPVRTPCAFSGKDWITTPELVLQSGWACFLADAGSWATDRSAGADAGCQRIPRRRRQSDD